MQNWFADVNLSPNLWNSESEKTVWFNEFFEKHCFVQNYPAIFRSANTLIGSESEGGEPYFPLEHLQRCLSRRTLIGTYGDKTIVPVTDEKSVGGSETKDYFCSDEPITLGQFFAKSDSQETVRYLKDWHYLLLSPEPRPQKGQPLHLNTLYHCPKPLQQDWLNEYCLRHRKDDGEKTRKGEVSSVDTDLFGKYFRGDPKAELEGDYRFVYIGQQNSTTPPHIDVFGSYSWSFNVMGTKRWRFYTSASTNRCSSPAEQEMCTYLSTMPNNKTSTTLIPDQMKHFVEIIQRGGDLVFVPSHVYHSVENLPELPENSELIVSVNHNWFNRHNIENFVVRLLRTEAIQAHESVDEETRVAFRSHPDGTSPSLGESDPWFQHVEFMLQCSGSWNLQSMRKLLEYIVSDRSEKMKTCVSASNLEDYTADCVAANNSILQINQAINIISAIQQFV